MLQALGRGGQARFAQTCRAARDMVAAEPDLAIHDARGQRLLDQARHLPAARLGDRLRASQTAMALVAHLDLRRDRHDAADLDAVVGELAPLCRRLGGLSVAAGAALLDEASLSRLQGCSHLTQLRLTGLASMRALPGSVTTLRSLRDLELADCARLASLPDVQRGVWPALTRLVGRRLPSMSGVPQGLGILPSLVRLSLTDCPSLVSWPEADGPWAALTLLRVKRGGRGPVPVWPFCDRPPPHLRHLHLEQIAVGQRPGWCLPELTHLSLVGAPRLERLPSSPGTPWRLVTMALTDCHRLEALGDRLVGLSSLTSFCLAGVRGLERVGEETSELRALQALAIDDAPRLALLPDEVGLLAGLTSLTLRGVSSLLELPASLGWLHLLQRLEVTDADALQMLPDDISGWLSLRELTLQGVPRLELLPPTMTTLPHLCSLTLTGATRLWVLRLPEGAGSTLTALSLRGCSSLGGFDEDAAALSSLRHLDLDGCERVGRLPAPVSALVSLARLTMGGCSALESAIDVLAGLPSLTMLHVPGADPWRDLSGAGGGFVRLRELVADGVVRGPGWARWASPVRLSERLERRRVRGTLTVSTPR